MCAGTLPSSHGEPDEPEDEKYDGCDPQEMDGKAQAKEEQHEQKCENE
jgi:hypothetical protein